MNPGKRDDECLQYASISGNREKKTQGRQFEGKIKVVIDGVFIVNEDFRENVKYLVLKFLEMTQSNPS